jgi:1-acyl-sn-glycerol-3-phosphate acyltransferase
MVQKTLYQTMRNLVNTYASLMFDKNVAWHEPFPKGAKILAVNHPSTIDPVMLTTIIPEHVSIMISETLFKVPVLGSWLKNSGHIKIIHGQGQRAMDEATGLLESGQTVAIFPEGAISPIGGFHKGHRGVARLVLLTGAPIIPVGIYVAPDYILADLKERWQ